MGLLILSSTSWNIGRIQPYSWRITDSVSKALEYSWDIYGFVTKAFSYSWDIEAYIAREASAFSWEILNNVRRAFSYSWRILNKYSSAKTEEFPGKGRDKEFDVTGGRSEKNTRRGGS